MRAVYPCVYHVKGDISDAGGFVPHKGMCILEESTRTPLVVVTDDLSFINVDAESVIHDVEFHPEAGALIYDPSIFPRLIGTPV
jgi:hypothetical protein